MSDAGDVGQDAQRTDSLSHAQALLFFGHIQLMKYAPNTLRNLASVRSIAINDEYPGAGGCKGFLRLPRQFPTRHP